MYKSWEELFETGSDTLFFTVSGLSESWWGELAGVRLAAYPLLQCPCYYWEICANRHRLGLKWYCPQITEIYVFECIFFFMLKVMFFLCSKLTDLCELSDFYIYIYIVCEYAYICIYIYEEWTSLLSWNILLITSLWLKLIFSLLMNVYHCLILPIAFDYFEFPDF